MREGWCYKKLGEVCEIVGGSTPKTNIAEYWEGDNMWVTPAELIGEKYFHHTERTISDAAVKSAHLQLLPVGTVLLSSRAPIGKVAITTSPMYCNQGFKNAICSDAVKNDYVYWYLLYSKESLQALGTGATFKEISKKTVSEFSIPIPPLTTQQQIVSELDLLSHILDQKRQQLKEYDALAESIFYDMFGDPVENPKGWEVKKLESLVSINSKLVDPKIEPYCEMCHVGPANIVSGTGEIVDVKKAKEETLISGKYLFDEGMILYSKIRPALNKVALSNMKGLCSADMYPLSPNLELIDAFFLRYVLSGPSFLKYAIEQSGRARMPKINREALFAFEFPLPPLDLQQSFASKIRSIEHQKQLLRASIKETEMLFQSRMDYWFNS